MCFVLLHMVAALVVPFEPPPILLNLPPPFFLIFDPPLLVIYFRKSDPDLNAAPTGTGEGDHRQR